MSSSQLVRQFVYRVSYSRYTSSALFDGMETALKLCVILKYYEQDCHRRLFSLRLRQSIKKFPSCHSQLNRHHVAARFYCNFYLVPVYHPPPILNVSRSLNNSRNATVNMEKDLNRMYIVVGFNLKSDYFEFVLS